MNLSFRDIEYFLTLAESGHMGRAAAVHGVTQSALSKSLSRLEKETGLTLFERSSRRIWLNASGRAFVDHARLLYAQYQDALQNTSALQTGAAGMLRIGATAITLDNIVAPALQWLMPKRPALKVSLTTGLSDALFEQVKHGDLDLVIAPIYGDSIAELDHKVLMQDTMKIVASTHHPVFDTPTLHIAELQAYGWIVPLVGSSARQALLHWLNEQGLNEPRVALEVPLVSRGILDIVASTDFISFAPESLLQRDMGSGVAALPIALPQRRKLCLLSRKGAHWTPLMEGFRDAVEHCI
ncbi:MAG: LysR family transcriptional regulator [Advenella sp.]|uniref:LysR family transcriptional regulator n=1 Tax=Advenella kashmirensis TaxID=310575 RepID=A0A356LDG2_9BURK|nr:LysR family transcriptional regulator [Advenella sp. FME57]HBP28555.1 LysR family transcriptional regulator [Advenella kashmirensis]